MEILFPAETLVVCPDCYRLRGKHGCYEQRCRCRPRAKERWPGFDFNTSVELCYCCAAEGIPSGSRWSSFYCEPCRLRVRELNQTLGVCAIPVGRHSIMNRIVLSGEEALVSELARERFVRDMRGMVGAIDVVYNHAGEVVRDNLVSLGFDHLRETPLVLYLAAADQDIDRAAAFTKLKAVYGIT